MALRFSSQSGFGGARLPIVLGALALVFGFAEPAAAQSRDACADPMASCGALIESACLERFGAGSVASAPVGAECSAQMAAYRSCVSGIAERCPSGQGLGGGGGDASDRRMFCQSGVDSCLAAIDQDYRDCRAGAGSDQSCREECRDERDLARDRCSDALRSCQTTGDFRQAGFVAPDCGGARPFDAGRAVNTPPVKPAGDLPQIGASSFGAVCRADAQFFCYMLQPAILGSFCTCSGAPALGVPPFQGIVMPQ